MGRNGAERIRSQLPKEGRMEKYPVDPDNIEKGMVIAKDEIERITGEKAGTDAYRLKVLGLKEKIEDMMRDAGRPMRLCSDHDSLVILKDNEASEYNERRFESLKRGVLRAIRSQLEVDTGNLTVEQSSRHTRRLH
ncbi:MAG: hypothetical protein DRQ56_10695, partial [Gammaproteobacteria bacterium]